MLLRWAEERGVEIEIFEDHAVSRAVHPACRGGWSRLLSYLAGGGTVVFCYEDRLGSEPWGLLTAAARLASLGVAAVCLHPSPLDSISWPELRVRSDAEIIHDAQSSLASRTA